MLTEYGGECDKGLATLCFTGKWAFRLYCICVLKFEMAVESKQYYIFVKHLRRTFLLTMGIQEFYCFIGILNVNK